MIASSNTKHNIMAPQRKTSTTEILDFIKMRYRSDKQLPKPVFIARYFKLDIHTIYNRLNELEATGKIKRILKNERHTSYRLKR